MSDMFLNFSAYMEQTNVCPSVFGLEISQLDVAGIASRIGMQSLPKRGGARLFVSPNIQHVSLMRRDRELRKAMERADLVTCDGFPVVRYAKFRGCALAGRVTAREVVDELLNRTDLEPWHRLFFLVDNDETADALRGWLVGRDLTVEIEIAPMDFGKSREHCAALADRITAFAATIVFLGVGAPRGELFAARYREHLPDGCWALCIGQSIKIALGLVTTPPAAVRALDAEWLWRLMLEPKRLIGRYCDGTIGFALAVYKELSATHAKQNVLRSNDALLARTTIRARGKRLRAAAHDDARRPKSTRQTHCDMAS